ncbi:MULTISPECIES: Uma2 family endonuclease [unclassified Streptomyces]|uniref:Uma2 family endonuclease n=1 Tax=unclassified Streptomyces TaxID=2593676 RepID=UPI002966A8FA|nr:Uma2 family endonuclease [Streptomyces sp. SJL17-1]
MTAEPMTRPEQECAGRWPKPPQDGWTVDDLLTLPDLPPHTELIDGSLVFVSPQRHFHSVAIDLLVSGLRSTVPPELRVSREMTVIIDRRNGPEPDVSVIRKEALKNRTQTSFEVADVLLAVEVVSPESEARDRNAKPPKYAAAGIEHFWLVEMEGKDEHLVVRVYELDPLTKTYNSTGTYRDRLKVAVPFPVDIDLTAIDEM